MRIPSLISVAVILASFITARSQQSSQFSSVPDLGVIYFSEHPKPQRFNLGGGTNCTVEVVTNYRALGLTNYAGFGSSNYSGPLVYVEFHATNADKTMRHDDLGWLPVELGKRSVYKAGGFTVRFTVEHKNP